ncbi:MAG: Phosphoglycerate mutase [Caulobacter sp.]|nr:Phosphoglycerate mutase [Caulobacter sp.]
MLTRHGEPALSRKIKLTAKQYGDWWGRYEEGGLLAGQTPPEDLKALARTAGVVVSSTRLRSRETAAAVTEGRAVAEEPLFIEAPLPPPHWPDWIRLSPRTWGFISRVWWWFLDHHDGQESRAQAEDRADEAALLVIGMAAQGQDVLVLAHGFFNNMVGDALRRKGWKCTQDQGFKYWCMRRFEKR